MATQVQPTEIDFDRIDTSRYEYVNGELRERPVPKNRHSKVQYNLLKHFGPVAEAAGLLVRPELSVDKEDVPQPEWMTPDTIFAAPEAKFSQRDNILPPFLLAVEIMSPEQTIPEMMRKAKDYFAWGVENVWIIDPLRECAVMLRDRFAPKWIWTGANIGVDYNGQHLSIPFADLLA